MRVTGINKKGLAEKDIHGLKMLLFRRRAKKAVLSLCALFCLGLIFMLCASGTVVAKTKKRIVKAEAVSGNFDCILVLGAGLTRDGTPSAILRSRLDTAVTLYKSGICDRIIMSGDHGTETYDEVNAMKSYAIALGVPSEHIFMDHAGFSTYESVYRARYIFGVRKMLIVSQKFHVYRALYIADGLGVEALAVAADGGYRKWIYNIRETAARTKDFLKMIFKPEPTYLGSTIPVSGNGDVTAG